MSDFGEFNLGFWWKQPGILVSKILGQHADFSYRARRVSVTVWRTIGSSPVCGGADCWLTGVEVGTIGWLASTHCLAEYHPSHPRRGGRETDAVCRRASVAAERYALGAVSTKQRAGQRSARRVGHRARYFSFRGTPVPQSTPALHPSRCGVQCLLASVRTGNISPVRYSRK